MMYQKLLLSYQCYLDTLRLQSYAFSPDPYDLNDHAILIERDINPHLPAVSCYDMSYISIATTHFIYALD